MPRYLVEILTIEIQRKIVVAANYEDAKEYALRDCNVHVRGDIDRTIDAKVIRTLSPRSFREDENKELKDEQ